MELSFKINEFEGPLDLLLYLISKHKMNICDIQIVELVDQFTNYLEGMEQSNMEIAGEFVEMATRLVYMKTVFLLPKHQEEKEDLRAQLMGELMEYKACKEAALKLRAQSLIGDIFLSGGEEIPEDKTFGGFIDKNLLKEYYLLALGKGQRRLPPPTGVFTPLVAKRVVSVTSRIMFLLKSLYKHSKLSWVAAFEGSGERSEMVATFLAVLELVKAKRVTISSNQDYIEFNYNKINH